MVTAFCFWYIAKKLDVGAAVAAMARASWPLVALSIAAYVLSKVVAAHRLNIYFRNIALQLPVLQNLRLYWLGMFYNLFLPGSISGDAYKVVLLNRRLQAPYRKTSAAVLLDRFSGLLGLGMIGCAYAISVLPDKPIAVALCTGCVLAVAAFYIVIRRWFPLFRAAFWTTLFWGLVVQAIQVLGIYLLLVALGVKGGHNWIFIFLVSAVLSVLPLSLGGGLGTREVVFTEGARFFGLDPHAGLAISLLFYLTSVLGSVPGLWYVFNDPLAGLPRSGGAAEATSK